MKFLGVFVILAFCAYTSTELEVDELSQRETFFDEVLKEGNIPSDLFPPKLRKWIEEAVERAVKLNYDDSEIENKEENDKAVEWIRNLLETERERLVEWILSDNFYYETDNWIELATSYAGKLLKIIPMGKWAELLTIMKDPEENIGDFFRKLVTWKYQRDLQELDSLDVKEVFETVESVFDGDSLKLFNW